MLSGLIYIWLLYTPPEETLEDNASMYSMALLKLARQKLLSWLASAVQKKIIILIEMSHNPNSLHQRIDDDI
jgi:hypothetical protein